MIVVTGFDTVFELFVAVFPFAYSSCETSQNDDRYTTFAYSGTAENMLFRCFSNHLLKQFLHEYLIGCGVDLYFSSESICYHVQHHSAIGFEMKFRLPC